MTNDTEAPFTQGTHPVVGNSRRRASLLLLMSLTILLGVLITIARWRHASDWEEQLRLHREAGFPTTRADMEAMYPPIPDAENAAPFLLDAARSLPAPREQVYGPVPIVGSAPPVHQSKPFSQAKISAMASYLDDAADSFGSLTVAVSRPGTRFEIEFDWWDSGVQFRQLRLLLDSALLQIPVAADAGDGQAVLDAVEECLAIVHSVEHVPKLDAYKQGRWMTAAVMKEAERALLLGALSDEQLAHLSDTFAALPDRRAAARAMRGYAYGLIRFHEIHDFSWDMGISKTNSLLVNALPDAIAMQLARVLAPVGGGLYATLRMGDRLASRYLARMRDWTRTLEAQEASPRRRAPANRNVGGDAYASRHLPLPDIAEDGTMLPLDTRRDMTLVRIALERYRLRHGQWPDTLKELVPGVVERLPPDPFGDGPFLYRRAGDDFFLYSVGPNGIDDGGTAPSGTPSHDITMGVGDAHIKARPK